MSRVQIDDFNCPKCKKITMAELDIKSRKYTCLVCGDGEKMKKLNGCVSNNEEEIDGKEFEVETLQEFIEILKNNKEVHLNYFDDEDDLDLWVKTK